MRQLPPRSVPRFRLQVKEGVIFSKGKAPRRRARFPHMQFLLVAVLSLLCCPPCVIAHPMGNFSINHFSGIEMRPALIRLSYVIDMAEIPTFQEMQEHGLTAHPDDPKIIAYRERKVQELQQGLTLVVGKQKLALSVRTSTLSFPPGVGGLPTLRISAVYEAPLEATEGRLSYEDRNYLQRTGWKEIVATVHGGVKLSFSSVPTESKSHQLTVYATDMLQAPPQDVRAALVFTVPAAVRARALESPKAEAVKVPPRTEAQTPKSLVAELVSARQLSGGIILFSLLIAVGLGALHALEPGHGKTLIAAYLVGSRGTPWQALLLGLTVTASHTLGVYILGGVALFASQYVLPEQLYPWLGFTSGLLIMGAGVVLLIRAWREGRPRQGHASPGRAFHYHGHAHEHAHPHHHEHFHAHAPHRHVHDLGRTAEPVTVGYGALLTLGMTGGMAPCPAALVVLLSAITLRRLAFGFLLIVAFSFGLAVVLVGTGLLLVSARGIVQRWSGDGPWLVYLPFVSPLLITPLGLVIAVRSLFGTGLISGF